MNNNYILARWRDAITDPPPDCWMGSIRVCGKERPLSAYVNGWFTSYSAEGNLLERARTGDQWLDITDRPGVPREAVQAAVDEIKLVIGRVAEGMYCEGDDPCVSDPIINAYAAGMDVIGKHTGVTPTEVTNG